MKVKILLCALLLVRSFLAAETVVQAGVESFIGPNRMVFWTPWAGLRTNLQPSSSLLFKFYFHNLRFRYINMAEESVTRSAHLFNFTSAYYRQSPKLEYYAALSIFNGTDRYFAVALDAGAGFWILKGLALDAGIYLLNESSKLWNPEDAVHRISVGSIKGGLRLKVFKWLTLNPRFNLYRTTDEVSASNLAFGLILVPREPITISLAFSRYRESAAYRYAGNYLELSLNYYR